MNIKRGDILYNKGLKAEFKVLGPEDFEGYEANRPGEKWELVEIPEHLRTAYGGRDKLWMGANPDFVEVRHESQS